MIENRESLQSKYREMKLPEKLFNSLGRSDESGKRL